MMTTTIARRALVLLLVLAPQRLHATPADEPGIEAAGRQASFEEAPPASHPAASEERRAGAWDRSVRLERRGDVAGARRILVQAYGARPETYEVTVRLAWLALRLHQAREAIDGYRRALELEGAGPEAAEGLRSALVLLGSQALARGDRAGARRSYGEALRLRPGDSAATDGLVAAGQERALSPALWLGYLGGKLDGDWSSAGVLVLQVPIKLTDHLQVRATYRHVEPLSGSDSSSGSLFGRQDELFGAIGITDRVGAVELHGFAAFPSGKDAIPGVALATRLGWRWGMTLDASALVHSTGWNYQLQPSLFYWPRAWLGLAAGTRVTWDPAGTSASAQLGASLRLGPRVELELEGHLGTERWPLSLTGPTLFALDATFVGGLSAVVTARVHRELTLTLQLQGERLSSNYTTNGGSYLCIAAGLRWSPALHHE